MRIFNRFLAGVGLGCALLCGCGQTGLPETVTENTLSVDAQGAVTEYLVDTFDRDYYSLADLEKMAVQEAAAYNASRGAGEVKMEQAETLPNDPARVMIRYTYDSADTFVDFNRNQKLDKLFYFGTVADAKEYLDQVGTQAVFTGVKKSDSIAAPQLLSMQDKHVIITDVPAVIYCPYPVTYVSQGLSVREDGGVDTSGAADPVVVIVMKK